MSLNFITILALIISLICIVLLFLMQKKYKRLKKDAFKISLALKQARYGNINVRVSDLELKELENSLNRLLETMNDREMMIKEYQNTLSKKNLSLEEILKQEKQLQLFKEDFAATLTHDMKVPVIAELNSLNFLLEGRFGELNQKQFEILRLMKASNQELKELIENMLETYKLDKKQTDLKITQNLLNEFLKETIEEMQPIILKTNHKIIFNSQAENNLKLSFDNFHLKRVVKNLIQNALTFSSPETNIIVEVKKTKKEIKIIFTNQGTPISKEDLDLIFNKYYSGHSKFRKAGTGLGLYLSRQIALAHKGSIDVDNSKENITSFILSLPLE